MFGGGIEKDHGWVVRGMVVKRILYIQKGGSVEISGSYHMHLLSTFYVSFIVPCCAHLSSCAGDISLGIHASLCEKTYDLYHISEQQTQAIYTPALVIKNMYTKKLINQSIKDLIPLGTEVGLTVSCDPVEPEEPGLDGALVDFDLSVFLT